MARTTTRAIHSQPRVPGRYGDQGPQDGRFHKSGRPGKLTKLVSARRKRR